MSHSSLLGAAIRAACCAVVCIAHAQAENRTYDGSLNNLLNPSWGAAGTTLLRKSIVGYDDGIAAPRGSLGAALPNPRLVSNAVVKQTAMVPNAHKMTAWVFQWGQFLDHDLDLTALASPAESLNIPIPAGDPIFDPLNTGGQIMPFQRSKYAIVPGGNTSAEPRQQINEITAYIDASQVYGSDEARALALRTLSDGLLKTSPGNLMPFNTMGLENGTGGPVPPPVAQMFYVAGDVRANEQVGLTAVHTLFVREHNRLAAQIAPQFAGIADPAARDEAIYQKARKIVGGQVQAITYNEFLPALLGGLAPALTDGAYDPAVNPSVSTEFSTALFRVGHTMLAPKLLRLDNDGNEAPGGPLALRDAFFRPANLAGELELEYLLKGLAASQQQEIDMHIVDDVRDFLFGEPIPGGFDLAALNIQRGRDHGLPGYNDVREAFGLSRKSTFAEITTDVHVQAALQLLYASPDALDPWVGALSEDHLPGAAVGELVAAGLRDQFTRARDGDRLLFTREDGLTADEKLWIMSRKLSDVILDNTEALTKLQDNVFFMPVPEAGSLAAASLALAVAAPFRRRSQ